METNTPVETIRGSIQEYATPVSIVIAGIAIAVSMYAIQAERPAGVVSDAGAQVRLEESVMPASGVVLPVVWGDLGARLVESGAIDADKLRQMYESRGTWNKEYEWLLVGRENGKLTITRENSGYLLNLLWAFGLANKSTILEDTSEMMNPGYGGAENFASTGGWTVAKGNAMEHYNMHALVELAPEQQVLVDRVSRNIYRPCCGNSTHFPDCNHGMAMLGFLELMASQGVGEEDMYKAALAVNSYWFPDTYLTIAEYMQNRGINWKKVSPQEMLGANYSSAAGFRNIMSQVGATSNGGSGSGCGVEAGGAPAPQQRQQSGCGI
ncbi:hypothetical protein A3F27_00080 [Candidatus Kaiserbacteria bacterium RIFCSPHIGHO2_12_FULL_53_13]|uniref:Uncharacterized protein n=1 Tax=Candidatus Kaiserbacteria bacterium RIFCSPHIGHO2_12_FULL_53_13 TaxID=1798502 RepID=A0A1F6EC44_9BACT|nr:MAG: hypothetical protein A3F27_00080 [Candidatus Kaiserbacteria bacterium RIFCSPHIGHO2_12_FULL_53_13]OGG74291.1 MAG: hypothetical protein A3A37_03145 [Candidatus Kaiserbacteria bacterium RIFCSPLOWO2_01_FULL_52_36]